MINADLPRSAFEPGRPDRPGPVEAEVLEALATLDLPTQCPMMNENLSPNTEVRTFTSTWPSTEVPYSRGCGRSGRVIGASCGTPASEKAALSSRPRGDEMQAKPRVHGYAVHRLQRCAAFAKLHHPRSLPRSGVTDWSRYGLMQRRLKRSTISSPWLRLSTNEPCAWNLEPLESTQLSVKVCRAT